LVGARQDALGGYTGGGGGMIYFHTSNPKSRAAIAVESLVPQVGECYASHYEDDDTPAGALRPAVFLALGQDNIFYSTWNDDLWEVDAEGLALEREEEGLDWFLCFDPILPSRLRQVYEGTGADKLNQKRPTP
jgi:hypothetical protein